MSNQLQPWVKALTRYFEEGIKQQASSIGVEVEQFIVNTETREAAPYAGENGVRTVVERLMALYPEAEPTVGEDLLGFVTGQFTITLEPAAQLEISIFPMERIACIEEIFTDYSRKLDSVLSSLGLTALPVGCQPESRVDELVMIPKERYRLMDKHFQQIGTGGREMMRGTCSVQASVDFTSEADFRCKVQAAHYFAPVLMLLADHADRFQGKAIDGHLKRFDIWERTDPARCGILPGVFSDEYGFAQYAAFLGRMPLIFREDGNESIPTGSQTVAELYEKDEPTREEILHILSMAFPYVRAKHYLEIRVADSMPAPYMLAYAALVKGMLYAQDLPELLQKRLREDKVSEAALLEVLHGLRQNGWEGQIYGHPARAFAEEALRLAEKHLDPEERDYLAPFRAVLQYGSISAAERQQNNRNGG